MAAVTALVGGDFSDGDATPGAVTDCVRWQEYVCHLRVTAAPVEDPSWNRTRLLDYHSEFVTLKTPSMERAMAELRVTLLVNNKQPGTARRGLIVSGPPGRESRPRSWNSADPSN
ncbi:hypothetical protein [Streptomyces sp. JCM 35825]|uniref:hypothetical protein n=1 Tax=Streptomyces sp. JCM 35825 TaxID=2930259 RepID=UPI0023497C95|nr:hypothetical protein [Streptomyces sp. JCM 35825]WCL89600.1 hypothetical protein PPN52_36210 [Streptomyces sp. JCM 35825]